MRQHASLALSVLAAVLGTAALVVAVLAATVFDDKQAINGPAAQAQGAAGRIPVSACTTAKADASREIQSLQEPEVTASSREVWPPSGSAYASTQTRRQCGSFVVDFVVNPGANPQKVNLSVDGRYDGPLTGPKLAFRASVPISQSTCSKYKQSVRVYLRKSNFSGPFAFVGGGEAGGNWTEPQPSSVFQEKVAGCALVDAKNGAARPPAAGSLPIPSEPTTYRVVVRASLKSIYGDVPLAVAAENFFGAIPQ